ncbi:uncharacterized protein IWZ02DRAFT_449039 [Phyllosticta citriasiana]|uniref:uncharacterized protein n=1 Tax=Phyllosticta citriasiana TaxID=595635 RepID=UPI0030FDEE78
MSASATFYSSPVGRKAWWCLVGSFMLLSPRLGRLSLARRGCHKTCLKKKMDNNSCGVHLINTQYGGSKARILRRGRFVDWPAHSSSSPLLSASRFSSVCLCDVCRTGMW